MKYLWLPALRCFGILQISPFRDVFVLHGSGVGGGSLGYANVLMQPDDILFANPAWKHLADWKTVLLPHFDTARRMLGVAPNPCFWPADQLLRQIAGELGTQPTFRPTTVGTFFGEPGKKAWKSPIHISAVQVRRALAARTAGRAWSAAATTPRTPW